MSLHQTIAGGALPGVRVVDSPEGLSDIRAPETAAVLWRRRPLDGFQAWVDALYPERLPRARVILRPGMVRAAMGEICDACATPSGPERDLLVDDVAALADLFAEITGAAFVRLRLDAVTTNACRKFHIDAVTARLICTYRGSGTQFGIAARGDAPEQVFAAATGTPIILRGTRWPQKSGPGLLHRSPPIEGSGQTRLVLVLDPVFDLEDEV